jgi:BASS family bile acid:Na+ symporter
MVRILNHRNFVFMSAVLLGLFFPGAAQWTKTLMIPALALVMTLATINVPHRYFLNPRPILKPSLIGILMTYGILSAVILILSSGLMKDENLRLGFVLIAAAPPAVAVIPFAAMLEGDVSDALSGTVASYLAALLLMPLIFGLWIKTHFDDPGKLVFIMLMLIVLPLLLSRGILLSVWEKRLAPVRGLLTDWSFFVVLYSMIGINSDLIFSRPLNLLPMAAVAFCSTFLLGGLIRAAGRLFKMNREKTVSLVLLGTLKNQGLAGGLAVALFEKEAALPSAIYSVFMILYIIWLGARGKRDLKSLSLTKRCR